MSIRTLTALYLCVISTGIAQQQQQPQQEQQQPSPPPAPTPSIIFASRDPDAITDYKENPKKVRAMVDRLVLAVTGQPDIARAWSSLVQPNDKIGIKISAAGGELFTTHHAVVNAIVDGLVAAGHSRSSIIVWDRALTGIKGAGYRLNGEGYQLRAIPPRTGYDAKAVFSAPVLGKLVWGDYEYRSDLGKTVPLSDTENTSNLSHFSKILVNDVTKIINVPVMSNSEMNGIAGCVYNVTVPNLDNWRRFSQGSRFGAASVAEIYADPNVGRKIVLNIMDGLVAQYGGGPIPQPNFSLHYATIYAAKDGVALDTMVLKMLEKWRKQANLPAIGASAFYLDAAGQMGLGNTAPDKIQIKNVGP